MYKTLAGKPLVHYLSIDLVQGNITRYVDVHSTLHTDKVTRLTVSYPLSWHPEEILNDYHVVKQITERYGNDIWKDPHP